MRTFLIFFSFLVFFNGCSEKNAFSEFNMLKSEELSVTSLLSSKILFKNGEINGIFSAIYLNEIYPQKFNDDEYFFVFYYVKDSKDINNPQNLVYSDLNIKLNSNLPLKILKLPEENKFSHLVNIRNNWSRYYLIAFKKSDSINLVLENGEASSSQLKYEKNK